jgi:hypothetical protein
MGGDWIKAEMQSKGWLNILKHHLDSKGDDDLI